MIFNSMYDCMKTLSYSWKYKMVIYYICWIYYLNEINLCLCYLVYFLVKIALIKQKSNLPYLNTDQKPFAY